ncbi:Protein transport protein sec31 [Aspergillus niger CBS 513,88] [Rhizoctonia solani]|uniref:Protein transport protein sec31 [Aspergillus niger CBS 513,88] n=1 Tax=Rhizoctonia solani TaxID=456999 RepID=A0A0K6GEV1_9AGAM|nr:Protein transport protein sec31 [Aspergillus niger CBS 513,88] [Rhizoctonia solani]
MAPKTPANPNNVFDPVNFAGTANVQNLGSSVNLEHSLKCGSNPQLVSGKEDKKHSQVHIKQVAGKSKVVEHAKDLIKAEESDSGMEAFVEAWAGKDKEVKDAKDTYLTLLALFDLDPKLALIKLVGYDAPPAALDKALAAVHAKTYEPVVLFATKATYAPHSPVGEESKGVQDKEGSKGTRTNVPGAAPSEDSTFSSDAKQVDAASTTTEPSLFGDKPVGGVPGPAAGNFFNMLASNNDTLPTRPCTALVPHLLYMGKSSAMATISLRTSRVASNAPPTPSFTTKSFHMHPKKEDLSLSLDHWQPQHSCDSGRYLCIFKGVVQGKKGLANLVCGSKVGEWCKMLVVLCCWANADLFASLVGELGERVWAARMPKEGKRETARVCFMVSKKLNRVVAIWEEEAKEEEGQDGNYGDTQQCVRIYLLFIFAIVSGAPKASWVGPRPGFDSSSVHAWAVQLLIEKAIVFALAIGFVNPNLQSSNKKTYVLALLYELFLEYTQILDAQGMVYNAVQYVKWVPVGYGDMQWLKGVFAKKAKVKPVVQAPTAPSGYGCGLCSGYGIPPLALSGLYGVLPVPAPGPYGVYAPLSGPYGAPAPSAPYGTTQAPGPYGAPSAQSPPFAPPHTTSTVKPATLYRTQGSYNPPPPSQQTGYAAPTQPSYGQQPFQNQQPGFCATMVRPPPLSMVPGPPPPMDQPSGLPPPQIIPASQRRNIPGWNNTPNVTMPQQHTPAPAGATAAAAITSLFTSLFPNSLAPGSPITLGPPHGSVLGNQEHIPDLDRIIFQVLSKHLARLKQEMPPQQKHMVDNIEGQLNMLFDAPNCKMILRLVVDQLLTLIQVMQVPNAQTATSIHVDLLTRGLCTDNIGLWMLGAKQLIIRM